MTKLYINKRIGSSLPGALKRTMKLNKRIEMKNRMFRAMSGFINAHTGDSSSSQGLHQDES